MGLVVVRSRVGAECIDDVYRQFYRVLFTLTSTVVIVKVIKLWRCINSIP